MAHLFAGIICRNYDIKNIDMAQNAKNCYNHSNRAVDARPNGVNGAPDYRFRGSLLNHEPRYEQYFRPLFKDREVRAQNACEDFETVVQLEKPDEFTTAFMKNCDLNSNSLPCSLRTARKCQ
jgi:hypothetical protein